jgi:hypothetical protein
MRVNEWNAIHHDIEMARQTKIAFANKIEGYLAASNGLLRNAQKACAELVEARISQEGDAIEHYKLMREEEKFLKTFFEICDYKFDTTGEVLHESAGNCVLSVEDMDEEYNGAYNIWESRDSAILGLFEQCEIFNKRLAECYELLIVRLKEVEHAYGNVLNMRLRGNYDNDEMENLMYELRMRLEALLETKLVLWPNDIGDSEYCRAR